MLKQFQKNSKVDSKLQKYDHEDVLLLAMGMNLDVVLVVVDELGLASHHEPAH